MQCPQRWWEKMRGVVQNGKMEIEGFSEKYNPPKRLNDAKTQKRTN